MNEAMAMTVWGALGAYAMVGGAIAALTLIFGLSRFDANAAAAPWRVKLALAPGMVALWPIIVMRLLGARPIEDKGDLSS